MKYSIIIFVSLALLISCSNVETATEKQNGFDITAVKNHILNMNQSYSKRFTTSDTAYYAERYCIDAVVYCPGLPAIKGRDSINAFFYANGANKEATIELPVGNIYGNEELVVEEGTYNFPDGKGGSMDNGKFMALWKQENGQWKLFREIWNSNK